MNKPEPSITMRILLYPKDILFLTMIFLILLVAAIGFFHSKKFDNNQVANHNKIELNSSNLHK